MSTQDATESASSGQPGSHHARHGRRASGRRAGDPGARAAEAEPAARSRIPLLVWAAVAINIGVMAVFTMLYPAYWAFDETGHVSRVLSAQHGDITPTPGAEPYVDGVAQSYGSFTAHDQPPFMQYQPQARDARPTMLDLGGATLYAVPGALPNQLAQHPPGYYLLAAGVLDIVPGSANLSWDQTVGLLRLLDVLILAPLPLLCWAIARRFARRGVALAAAFAPLLIPGLARLGASVNNDDLLILLIGVFTLLITDVMRGDGRMRTAVAIAACIAAGLLVKGFALVLPPIALIAYLVAWRRHKAGFPWQTLLAIVIGSAAGGLWWLRNLVVYGAIQQAGLTADQANEVWPPLPAGASAHVPGFVRKAIDVFSTDFWGALGLAAPPSLPGAITVIASIAAVVLVVVPFVTGRRSNRILGTDASTTPAGSRLVELGVLLLPTLLILAPLLVHGWADYHRTGQPIGIQGRYLYVGLIGLVGICAAGIEILIARAPGWVSRLLPLFACLLAFAIEATAIWVVFVKLWLPAKANFWENAHDLVRAIGAQSPWPGAMTLGIISATALASLVALVVSAAARVTRAPS